MHIQRLAPSHAPVFLVNSRYPLACATPQGSAREGHHPKGSPLYRRHGSGLPSSLTRIRSIALVYSTRPPVSVSGTGGMGPWRRSFSRQKGSPDSPQKEAHHHASAICPADLPAGRPARLTTENHLRGRLPDCVTPASAYHTRDPNTTRVHAPKGASTGSGG